MLVRTALAAVLLGLGLLVREIFGFAASLGLFAVAAMLVVAAVGRYRPRRRSRRARSWSAFAGGAGAGSWFAGDVGGGDSGRRWGAGCGGGGGGGGGE